MDLVVSKLEWDWNFGRHELAACVTLSDGRNSKTIRVRFPVSTLAARLDSELGAVGIYLPPTVSGPVTVAGFGKMMKRAKRALKKAGKSAGKVIRTVKRSVANEAIHLAKQAARSKVLGAGLGVAAAAFPAVGAPALAAWTTANRVVAAVDKAEAASKRLARGVASARDLQHVRNGNQLAHGVVRLARSAEPAARLLVAATRSAA